MACSSLHVALHLTLPIRRALADFVHNNGVRGAWIVAGSAHCPIIRNSKGEEEAVIRKGASRQRLRVWGGRAIHTLTPCVCLPEAPAAISTRSCEAKRHDRVERSGVDWEGRLCVLSPAGLAMRPKHERRLLHLGSDPVHHDASAHAGSHKAIRHRGDGNGGDAGRELVVELKEGAACIAGIVDLERIYGAASRRCDGAAANNDHVALHIHDMHLACQLDLHCWVGSAKIPCLDSLVPGSRPDGLSLIIEANRADRGSMCSNLLPGRLPRRPHLDGIVAARGEESAAIPAPSSVKNRSAMIEVHLRVAHDSRPLDADVPDEGVSVPTAGGEKVALGRKGESRDAIFALELGVRNGRPGSRKVHSRRRCTSNRCAWRTKRGRCSRRGASAEEPAAPGRH
mmetsp:Transcript_13477/g.43017  ORF Transcript_13477/g.43017 Transcript_13477/m.43017 type:complete len:398 (+) Transcript_13477:910-2103(+)